MLETHAEAIELCMSGGSNVVQNKWLRLLVACLVLASPLMAAANENGSVFRDHWGFRIGLNYSSWSGLGDLEPAGTAGPFETIRQRSGIEGYTSIAKNRIRLSCLVCVFSSAAR